jgi:hypothetical protein
MGRVAILLITEDDLIQKVLLKLDLQLWSQATADWAYRLGLLV